MNRNVEIYIKKNTQVYAGITTFDNTSPFLTFRDTIGGFAVNQYTGHYAIMTSGDNIGATSWIVSNTASIITLETEIVVLAGDTYAIYKSDYQRLDLFKEEKISVTSQIQNANDIGKLYTDYSQSFNIPASKRNNEILEYWFESSLDNGFDHRRRYDAYIEIDTHRFKDGSIQLENAKIKNGKADSFNITFYGNLTQLKDVIKDDKLNSLDYSIYNHQYDSTNVIIRIGVPTTTGDIKYPLIGNAKKYYYQDTSYPSDDITTVAGAIKWNELFPAIKLSNIFLKIQSKYGLTFTGSFFSLDQWIKLYLYLKPSEAMTYTSQPVNFDFITKSASFPELSLTNDYLLTNFNFPNPIPIGQMVGTKILKITIRITPQAGFLTIPYTLYAYKDGILHATFNAVGTNLIGFTIDYFGNSSVNINENFKYTFKLSSSAAFSFVGILSYSKKYFDLVSNTYIETIKSATTSVQSTVANIQIANYIPDIKIIDFITGIVKVFNLMIIPKSNNTYEFAPLELYYNSGKILDITEYTYSEELSIEKPKLFKSINFKYEESKNILNNAFKGIYNYDYGDLIYNSERIIESVTYDIKLPFENVLFEVPKQGKLFQTATLIDKDQKPYIPKPMLIYCNGLVSPTLAGADRIYVTNTGGGTTLITNYNRFSNEYDSLPTDVNHSHLMTMNFGNEQSSWLNELAPQGLYFRHYKNYIDNLYNIKTRIIKVKALLPSSLLNSTVTNGYGIANGIALNDRLIIRNKRYIINSFTTDLTSGEASFELITDYRGVDAANSVGYRFANMEEIQTDKDTLDIDLIVYLNDYDKFDVKGPVGFLLYTALSNNTKDVSFIVTVPVNATLLDRTDVIGLEYYKNGSIVKNEYIIVTQTAI